MAKSKVNKSDIVRELLASDPTISVKDVVAKVAELGHKVTPNLVYFLKGKAKGAKKRKKRIAKAATAAASRNGTATRVDAITMIRDVKALAARAGGYAKLKQLVDALAE
jgi:hypothetical protein